jgi:RsiW-degrading membrane proteinase PrsW (M82 family)
VPFAFLALALLPFLIDHLSFGHAKWGFAVYFAGIWFFAIRALIKPETVSHWRLAGIALFTVVVGVPLAIALEGDAGTSNSFIHNIFGVGLPEELAKALPVFLFVFLSKQLRLSPRTYLYIGAVSGLAFGAVEAAHYSDLYAVLSTFDSGSLMNEVWRIAADPVMHACWAGICCYFIGLASTHRSKKVPLIAFGLGVAALLHGAYDTTADGWLGVAVFAVSLFVFVGYVLSAERIANDYHSVAVQAGTVASLTNPSDQALVSLASSQSTGLIDHNIIEQERAAYEAPWPATSCLDIGPEGNGRLASAAASCAGAGK